MQLGARGGHVGVALVGADHYVACSCDAEVGTRHACVSRQELVAKAEARHISKVCWVVVALFLRDALLLEQFAHVVVVQVDGRHHDVAGFLALQLDDALAEVGFYHFYALAL